MSLGLAFFPLPLSPPPLLRFSRSNSHVQRIIRFRLAIVDLLGFSSSCLYIGHMRGALVGEELPFFSSLFFMPTLFPAHSPFDIRSSRGRLARTSVVGLPFVSHLIPVPTPGLLRFGATFPLSLMRRCTSFFFPFRYLEREDPMLIFTPVLQPLFLPLVPTLFLSISVICKSGDRLEYGSLYRFPRFLTLLAPFSQVPSPIL